MKQALERIVAARPRVAAELERPHAEEALLAGVVGDLVAAGAVDALGPALGAEGAFESALLWGADPLTGVEDLRLAAALHEVAPDAGRAALLDAEPDLVVVSAETVVAVDVTVGRPGHAAARAARGETVPPRLLQGVQDALRRHGIDLDGARLARAYAPARLAAVTLTLADALDRRAVTVALAGRAVDLLRPERDDVTAWSDAAVAVLGGGDGVTLVELRALSWLQVADRLTDNPRATRAVARIRAHPVLAASRR